MLISQLRRTTFRPGESVFPDGQQSGQLDIVIAGKVKIGWCSPSAPEKLLAVLGPSDIFGAESMFDPGPRTGSATAITDVVAAVMDRDALDACTEGHPQITEQFMRASWHRTCNAPKTTSPSSISATFPAAPPNSCFDWPGGSAANGIRICG